MPCDPETQRGVERGTRFFGSRTGARIYSRPLAEREWQETCELLWDFIGSTFTSPGYCVQYASTFPCFLWTNCAPPLISLPRITQFDRLSPSCLPNFDYFSFDRIKFLARYIVYYVPHRVFVPICVSLGISELFRCQFQRQTGRG